MTVLIVLVTVCHDLEFNVSGDCTGGDSGIGDAIAFIVFQTVCIMMVQEMPLDVDAGKVEWVLGKIGFSQKLIGENNDGNLVFFCQIKGLNGLIEGLPGCSRGQDDSWELILGGMEGEKEIPLGRSRG
jgi:hypothetical protein